LCRGCARGGRSRSRSPVCVAERGRGHRRAPDRSLRRPIGRRLGGENPAPVLQKPARVLQTERIGSNTRTHSLRDRARGTWRRCCSSCAALFNGGRWHGCDRMRIDPNLRASLALNAGERVA
jgi:hypothetical protein